MKQKEKVNPDLLPVVRNQMNKALYPKKGETFKKPSMTQPNQSMTIKEIVERHKRGFPIDGAKIPIYQGEDALPDISHLDLAEQQEIIEAMADQLVDVKQRLQAIAKDKKEKEELERIEKIIQERLKNSSKAAGTTDSEPAPNETK